MILDHLDNRVFSTGNTTYTMWISLKWLIVVYKLRISDTVIIWNLGYKNEINGVSRLGTIFVALR